MSISRWLLLTIALVALSGCTSIQQESGAQPVSPLPLSPTVDETPTSQHGLSGKQLFNLLVAEFALQRGEFRLAANAYLEGARMTRDPRLARQAGGVAMRVEDFALATSAAELWVELAPDDEQAVQSLIAILIRSDRSAEALPYLRGLIARTPEGGLGGGYLGAARQLANSNRPQQALQQMEELIGAAGERVDALYAHAWLAQKLGDLERASGLLQRLLLLEPRHIEAMILQAQVLHGQGRKVAAAERLRSVLKLEPENERAHLGYARILAETNKLEEAREEFLALNRRLPENGDVIFALALLAMEMEEIDSAESYFMDLLRLGEHEVEARFNLAQIARLREQPREAIEWYRSVPQGEYYISAQINIAQIFAVNKGVDVALGYLRRLRLARAEDDVIRYRAGAELLVAEQRLEEALAIYGDALERYPDNIDLLYDRAMVAAELDRLDVLESDLQSILAMEPQNVRALNALGYTLADRTDRYDEAFAYIEQAYRLRSDDPAILDSMGWGLYRLGRLPEALEFLRRAAGMLQDAEIAAHMGEVLWISGQREEARRIWGEASEADPEHRVLRETIRRFAP